MTFVQVVPLRRMPADRTLFTYLVPDQHQAPPGTLVVIPFRNRPILGVVWSILEQPPAHVDVSLVHSLPLDFPLMSAWQMSLCQAIADTAAASLGEVLQSVLPDLSIKTYQRLLSGVTRPDIVPGTTELPTTYLWYRDREQALTWILAWVRERCSRPTIVISPTFADGREIANRLEKKGIATLVYDSQLSSSEKITVFQRIVSGTATVVVGTTRALALPFSQPPSILVDQEEHHAHKQTAQHPRLDVKVLLNHLGANYSATTASPSLPMYTNKKFVLPPPLGNRVLVSLDRPGLFNWIAEETATVIDQALIEQRRCICIAPRRGYASATRCRACGFVQTCPTCHQRVTLFRGTTDEAFCRFCRQTISLHGQCPNCQASTWSVQGIGLEFIAHQLSLRWPDATIAPAVRADVPVDIAVDSYIAYHQLRHIPHLGPVVVVSGDSLLNVPDYATSERAWHYLARLQAEHPSGPIVVQTFSPELPFWQRWLHGDDVAWYNDELLQRQRLRLPPFTVQWIAHYRGSAEDVEDVYRRLHDVQVPQCTVERLPTDQRRNAVVHRLLLVFTDVQTAESFPWKTFFPTPWHVDMSPQTLLD